MTYKLGLKLWSTNTESYLREAQRLYTLGVYDYIELYIVPNTLDTLDKWSKLKIPFTLHAPHFMHGVNLANSEKFEYNKEIYREVEIFRSSLNAKYTVIHGGIEGNVEETIRQLRLINPKNFLIENKPYIAPLGNHNLCRGYNIEEIKKITDETNCGFCLDIGHCICSANSMNIEPYLYVREFNKLDPKMYHLSDGEIDSEIDKHLHFGQGNFDIKRILGIISKDKCLSIETNKNSKENLEDFIEDVLTIRTLENEKP